MTNIDFLDPEQVLKLAQAETLIEAGFLEMCNKVFKTPPTEAELESISRFFYSGATHALTVISAPQHSQYYEMVRMSVLREAKDYFTKLLLEDKGIA